MNKDSLIPEIIKDPKHREYFVHLQDIIEKQNKEISVHKQFHQILKLNYRQDLKHLLNELLDLFWDDQFSSIRIVIKKKDQQTEDLVIAEGRGSNNAAYAYLDTQVEEQLGKPGILYISDTAKIHSIKFVSGSQYPKTILGISLKKINDKFGMIWFACENQKNFTKFESDTLISLVEFCTSVVQNCLEWNENSNALSFRNEILNKINFPILVITRNEIIFANLSAKQSINPVLENINEKEKIIRKIWNFENENENLISIDNSDFQVKLIDDNLNLQKSFRAAILVDATLPKKQRDYLSLIIESISQGLRSPLNLILGSIKMLPLVGEVNSHQNEYIKSIQLKAEESLKTIEDLLELERIIESSGLRIQAEPIQSLVSISSSLINHLAKQKRISILNKTSNPEGVINVDKVLFTQAIANIFEYAIGQTRLDGEIAFSAVKNLNKCILTINDTSNGLSQVEVDRLNSLENLHEVPSNLRLVRRVIDFHGGTFMIQSDLGKGNSFIIEIPC